MNMSEANHPFLRKTLCTVVAHLYKQLGVHLQDHILKEKNETLRCMPAVAKHLKEILLKKSLFNTELLVPKISSFEWLTNLHEVFNATLMDTSMLIAW